MSDVAPGMGPYWREERERACTTERRRRVCIARLGEKTSALSAWCQLTKVDGTRESQNGQCQGRRKNLFCGWIMSRREHVLFLCKPLLDCLFVFGSPFSAFCLERRWKSMGGNLSFFLSCQRAAKQDRHLTTHPHSKKSAHIPSHLYIHPGGPGCMYTWSG